MRLMCFVSFLSLSWGYYHSSIVKYIKYIFTLIRKHVISRHMSKADRCSSGPECEKIILFNFFFFLLPGKTKLESLEENVLAYCLGSEVSDAGRTWMIQGEMGPSNLLSIFGLFLYILKNSLIYINCEISIVRSKGRSTTVINRGIIPSFLSFRKLYDIQNYFSSFFLRFLWVQANKADLRRNSRGKR